MGCGKSKARHASQRQTQEAVRPSRTSSTLAEQGSLGRPIVPTVQSPAKGGSTRQSRHLNSELPAPRAYPNTSRSSYVILEPGSTDRSTDRSSRSAVPSAAQDRSTRQLHLRNSELPAQRASCQTPPSSSLIVERGSSERSNLSPVPSVTQEGSTHPSPLPSSEIPALRASREMPRSASLTVQQGSPRPLNVPSVQATSERGSSRSSSTSSPFPTGSEVELEPRNLFTNWQQEETGQP